MNILRSFENFPPVNELEGSHSIQTLPDDMASMTAVSQIDNDAAITADQANTTEDQYSIRTGLMNQADTSSSTISENLMNPSSSMPTPERATLQCTSSEQQNLSTHDQV